MTKLYALSLLIASSFVASDAVVRGQKQSGEQYDDERRALHGFRDQKSRSAQESYFGIQSANNHIGVPVSLPAESVQFEEEVSSSSLTSSPTTAFKGPPPPPEPKVPPLSPPITSKHAPDQASGDDDLKWTDELRGSGSSGNFGQYSGSQVSGSQPGKGKGKGSLKLSGSRSKGIKGMGSKGESSHSGSGSSSSSWNGSSSNSWSVPSGPKKKEDKKGSVPSKKIDSKMGKISKGKGKGKGLTRAPSGPPVPRPPTRPPIPGVCLSPAASSVVNQVPEAIARNPDRCCDYEGPVFAIVTHALPAPASESGFDSFWNTMYLDIDKAASAAGICFFMTGIDASVARDKSVSKVMIEINSVISEIASVPAMMTTDPTDNPDLMKKVRSIFRNPALPSIGVFNSGYNNVVAEALLSNADRLPYVGSTSELSYGQLAADATIKMLDNIPPVAVCFSADYNTTVQRCQEFYNSLGADPPQGGTTSGILCNTGTSEAEILSILNQVNANVVFSHQDCCQAASIAAQQVRASGRIIVVGCMDVAPEDFVVDFVTSQPITLQAHATSAWAGFPVLQQLHGRDGREPQYFPSLKTLINTVVENAKNQ